MEFAIRVTHRWHGGCGRVEKGDDGPLKRQAKCQVE